MTTRTWQTSLESVHAYSGHTDVVLRFSTTSSTHAAEILTLTTGSPEADRDAIWNLAKLALADNTDWERLEQSQAQLVLARHALDLAVARQEEATSALKIIRLQPETKSWAAKLASAEAALATVQGEAEAARATVATLERAVGEAAEAVRPAVELAVDAAWHQFARAREELFGTALADAAAAIAPALPALVATEALRRPVARPMHLVDELIQGLGSGD